MTDRELLELAAKAIDLRYHDYTDFGMREQVIHGVPHCGHEGPVWNPLTDDGDALRLAIKLSISLDVNGMFVHADCRHCENDLGYFEENSARNDGCIAAATRRAIVRAAAEIAKVRGDA